MHYSKIEWRYNEILNKWVVLVLNTKSSGLS